MLDLVEVVEKVFATAALRELDPQNVLFPEISHYHWTPKDLRLKRNIESVNNLFRKIMDDRRR